ncbi:hypothetical protein [Streptomyces griseoluteus]|uniref:hypothetical protein n=1 Tax=Streptomyces griseoluteus TaxID=29306 RepID=UPI0038107F0A
MTTYDFDDQTLRLKERVISRTQAPGPTVDDTKYSYDAAGNPTSIRDAVDLDGHVSLRQFERSCQRESVNQRVEILAFVVCWGPGSLFIATSRGS